MKNLEQLRAMNAQGSASSIKEGEGGSKVIAKKVPAMIMANGFLGAMAFAIEPKGDTPGDYKNPAHASVFEAILKHFKSLEKEGLISFGSVLPARENDLESLFQNVSGKGADVLRAVTAESIAYLNYLRRFAKSKKNG